jgi:hypothetical protein
VIVAAAVFVLLGVVFVDKALRSGATRNWAWGRMGEGPPLSRAAYAAWGFAFFAIAFTIWRAPHPGWRAAAAVGACLVAIIVVGIFDTRADRRRSSEEL